MWNSIGVTVGDTEWSSNPSEWLWKIFSEGNNYSITNIMLGIYLVWRNRNRVVHGEHWWTIEFCTFIASCLQSQFDLRRLPGIPEEQGSGDEVGEGWAVFCDGSCLREVRRGGWAAVVRKGDSVMGCTSDFAKACCSVLQAKINGIVAGLQVAARFKCKRAIIFSDCVEAIWAFQRGLGHDTLNPDSLMEGFRLLRANPPWELRYVFRDGNRGADFLATKAAREEWAWNSNDALPLIPNSLWA